MHSLLGASCYLVSCVMVGSGLKQARPQGANRVVQVVERLPSKCKAQSSNPSTPKTKQIKAGHNVFCFAFFFRGTGV
jgi:hypothetical protein